MGSWVSTWFWEFQILTSLNLRSFEQRNLSDQERFLPHFLKKFPLKFPQKIHLTIQNAYAKICELRSFRG